VVGKEGDEPRGQEGNARFVTLRRGGGGAEGGRDEKRISIYVYTSKYET
jgi:hypothetical protein